MPEVTDSLDWLVVFFIHEIYDEDVTYRNAYNAMKKEIAESEIQQFNIRAVVIEEKLVAVTPEFLEYTYNFLELTEAGLTVFKFSESTDVPKDWKTALEYFLTTISAKNRLMLTWSHGAAFGINTDKFPIKFKKTDSGKKLNYIKSNGQSLFADVESADAEFEIKGSFEIVENNAYRLYVDSEPDNAGIKKNFFPETVDIKAHFKTHKASFLEKNNFNSKIEPHYFRKFSLGRNCKDLQILWIWEITEVLERCRHIIKPEKPVIDILVMANCFTNLIDNWFLFKDVVKYYIAPETSMDVNGYNYTLMIRSLISMPAKSTELIASAIIDDFVKKNQADPNPVTKDVLQKTSIFCADLSATEKAMEAFTEICRTILDEEKNMSKEIFSSLLYDLRYIRKFDLQAISETYAGTAIDVVDLATLLDSIAERLKFAIKEAKTSDKLEIYSQEFRKLINSIIINSYTGETIVNADVDTRKKFSPTGASVFFPEQTLSIAAFGNIFGICAYSENTSPFTNHTLWDDLLKKVYP